MKTLIKYIITATCIPLLCACIQKKDTPTPEPDTSKNAELEAFLKETLTFKEVKIDPGIFGYADILFSKNGTGVALNNKNAVYTTYDNGKTWQKRVTVSGNTATCIALNPNNNSQLYVGGGSAGNFISGSAFWHYDLPQNGEPLLIQEGKTSTNQSEEPVGLDFTKVQWTADEYIFAGFSKKDGRDGYFGRMDAGDVQSRYVRLIPSFTSVGGMPPTMRPTSVPSFMVKGPRYGNSSIVLCASEYISSAGISTIRGYQYFASAPGWIAIHEALWYTGTWRVTHMGQDYTGKHSIWLTQNKLVYYNGEKVITTGSLPGDLLCSSIDNDNYIWIGTDRGMFKSEKPIP